MADEARFPHSPDVTERRTADGGFSDGWGMHFRPAEQYLIDVHTHLRAPDAAAMLALVQEWHQRMYAHRLVRHVALDGRTDTLEKLAAVTKFDSRLQFLYWMDHDKADAEVVAKAKASGAIGLKMHNYPLMLAGIDPQVYRSNAWKDVFRACAQHKMPVLWHVTQRYTASPYTGGGLMSYWKNQPHFDMNDLSKIKYGNRDQLAAFEASLADHRDVTFIGAHALHVGYPKLAELCDRHPNFCYDLSCCGFVRYGDRMLPEDADFIRGQLIQYADRVLFGTDCVLEPGVNWNLLSEHFLGHVRYLRELALPEAVLQKIAHGNAERLYGLPAFKLNPATWGALRP
ncbi:MAG: amidohydrolase family protein [Planctomycetota bacterium]